MIMQITFLSYSQTNVDAKSCFKRGLNSIFQFLPGFKFDEFVKSPK
jgi:hypothetical protein